MGVWAKTGNIKGVQGDQGPPGIQGEPGPGIHFMGVVPTFADLPTDAEPGDMWNTDDDGHSWTWNGTTWIDGGSSRGADGPPGPSNVLEIGTVTTVAPGGAATADITGTSPAQTLNLGIPRGDPGTPGVVVVSGTAPTTPVEGQLWWNSTTKTLLVSVGGVWEPVLATWG